MKTNTAWLFLLFCMVASHDALASPRFDAGRLSPSMVAPQIQLTPQIGYKPQLISLQLQLQDIGTLRQSLEGGGGAGLFLAASLITVSMLPILIGNIVALMRRAAMIPWGVTGIVVGSTGMIAAILFTVFAASPVFALLAPLPMFLVASTTFSLGIANVTIGLRRGRRRWRMVHDGGLRLGPVSGLPARIGFYF